MHGLIKFYATSELGDDELPCVLTEQQYFDFFNRPNSVFNYTFLYLLREFNCIFLGMSMRDDNIRRLLHYSTSERRGAGARAKEVDGKPPCTALRHFAILKRHSSQRDELIEISLRRLGTRVLWVRDYSSEIPERLAYIYEKPGSIGQMFTSTTFIRQRAENGSQQIERLRTQKYEALCTARCSGDITILRRRLSWTSLV